MAGKKKSLSQIAKTELDTSQDGKVLKGVSKLIPGGSLANLGREYGRKAKNILGTGMGTEQEMKDYVAGLGNKAWAKEKKKAGVKD